VVGDRIWPREHYIRATDLDKLVKTEITVSPKRTIVSADCNRGLCDASDANFGELEADVASIYLKEVA
jgi:hypothetical protein